MRYSVSVIAYFLLVLLFAVPGVADDVVSLFAAPTHTTPLLQATVNTNSTFKDLVVTPQNVADSDNDRIKNITDWRRNGVSIALVNMPFENNGSNAGTYDYSSNGAVGTVYGDANWNGSTGYDTWGVYDFDGSNDFINVTKVNLSQKSFTLSAWARRGGSGTWDLILAQGGANTRNGLHFGFKNTDAFIFGFWADDVATIPVYTDTKWHHWVATYNQSTRARAVYRDGALVALTAGAASADYVGQGDLQIGVASFIATTSFVGQIDEVLVFNRSLTSQEVGYLYANRSKEMHFLETNVGENWTVAVTPNDNTSNGATLISNEVVIAANTVPTQTKPILNATHISNSTRLSVNLTAFNQTTTDPDDVIKNIYDWWLGNSSITLVYLPFENNGSNDGTFDYSSYGNHLTALSTALWNLTGGYDGFDAFSVGSSLVDLDIPYKSSLKTSGPFTVTSWIYPNTQTGTLIIAMNGAASNTNFIFYGSSAGGGASIGFDSTAGFCQSAKVPLRRQEWSFVTGRYNGSNLAIYVNGTEFGSSTYCSALPDMDTTGITIGNYVAGGGPFDGVIDEFAFYNRSLSQNQIRGLYNNQTNVIHASELLTGENWTVRVTPNDGHVKGVVSMSASLVLTSNAAPNVLFVNLTSSGGTNKTTTNLTGAFSYYDSEGDANSANETVWYNNSAVVSYLANFTSVNSGNLSVGHNWTFSVRVSDGTAWSSFVNSSALTVLADITSHVAVSLTSPVVNTTTSGNVLLQTNMSGAINITNVSYYYQIQRGAKTLLGSNSTAAEYNLTQYIYAFNSRTLSDGIYDLFVNVTDRDSSGTFLASTEMNVSNITLDNGVPAVLIGLPTSGQVISSVANVLFNATITDTISLGSVYFNVTKIDSTPKFFLQASSLGSVGWNASLNSTLLSDMQYRVTVHANDTQNNLNSTESQIFYVNNYPPLVTAIRSPTVNRQNVSGSLLLNASLTEAGTSIDTVFFNITSSVTGVAVARVATSNLTSVDYNATFITTTVADGTYTLTVYANDTVTGNLNATENITFVVDNTVPSVSSIGLPTSGQIIGLAANVVFNATISDGTTFVNAVYFNITNSSGQQSQFLKASSLGAVGWNVTLNSTLLSDAQYTVKVHANDTLNNLNSTELRTFSINNYPPQVTAIRSPTVNRQNVSSSFVLNTSLTESMTSIDTVFFNITNSATGVAVARVATSNLTLTDYNATFVTTTVADGMYTLTIYANDTVTGNLNASENITFTVDNTVPLLHNITLPLQSGSAGTNFFFNVTLTEPHYDTVLAYVQSPDGNSTTNITLYRASGASDFDFNGTINSTWFARGVYNIDIYANDTLGNSLTKDNFGAILVEETANIRGVLINNSIAYPANTTTSVDAQSTTNVTLGMFMFSATTSSLTIVAQKNNLTNASLSGLSLGHYVTIDLDSAARTNLTNATITLYYQTSDIPTGANESNITISRFNTTKSLFETLQACSVDTTLNKVTCTTSSFSTFAASASANAPSSSSSSSSSTSSSSTDSAAGSGGGGGGSSLSCESDSACGPEERCVDERCHQLFSLDFVGTPVQSQDGVAFSYAVKGLTTLTGDVLIEYWLEQDGRKVLSGKRVEELDYYEKRTLSENLLAEEDLEPGVYDLFVRLTFDDDYTVLRQSTIEITGTGEIITHKVVSDEPSSRVMGLLSTTPSGFVKKMLLHVHEQLSPQIRQVLTSTMNSLKRIPRVVYVIGGILALILLALVFFLWRRQRKQYFKS